MPTPIRVNDELYALIKDQAHIVGHTIQDELELIIAYFFESTHTKMPLTARKWDARPWQITDVARSAAIAISVSPGSKPATKAKNLPGELDW